jgi:Rieske Fe-S protein
MTSAPCPLSTSCPATAGDDHACQDQHDRRQLLKQGVLAAIGATLLAACSRQQPTLAATPASAARLGAWSLSVRPNDFPPLHQDGGIARVDGNSDMPVAVVRTGQGYAAFSMTCPHAGATIDPVAGGFLCPGHGAQFSTDGKWTGGHPAKNLTVLGTTYDAASGVLTITV